MVTRTGLLALLILCACSGDQKRILIPPEMAQTQVATKFQPTRAPPPPPDHYTVRLAESGRVWELDIPENASGYEVRIPLQPGSNPALTAADAELLGGEVPDGGVPSVSPNPPRSYLAGVARVEEMYRDHRYELALIEVVGLQKIYPRDARLLAMKGSLLLKLGKPAEARQAYEAALQINPDDAGLVEALRALAGREEP